MAIEDGSVLKVPKAEFLQLNDIHPQFERYFEPVGIERQVLWIDRQPVRFPGAQVWHQQLAVPAGFADRAVDRRFTCK